MHLDPPDYVQMPVSRREGAALRVIVCGSRDYQDRERVFAAMDRLHARTPIAVVVHGACRDPNGKLRGADRWAHEWAEERGVTAEPHAADWKRLGHRAGPARNKEMANSGADGCIAFPGGIGTASMCACAKAAGIPIWRPYG